VTDTALLALADAAGLIIDWRDAHGRSHSVSPDALRAVLTALGWPCATPRDVADSIARLQQAESVSRAPLLHTADAGRPVPLRWLHVEQPFTLRQEDGAVVAGSARYDARGIVSLPTIETPGYHLLRIGEAELTLAVAPDRCFGVADVHDIGTSPWALATQLYALRGKDAGAPGAAALGDFSALAQCCRTAARHGAAAMAVSPVHAGFTADPTRYSPYSPSSRLFLNPLYADPAEVFGPHAVASALVALGLREAWRSLDASPLVEWPAAGAIKTAVMRHLFDRRASLMTPAQTADFHAFRERLGEGLEDHARFEALHASLSRQDHALGDWRHWPEALRNPYSSGVAAFATAHAEDVTFHIFLQWLAQRGLAAAQAAARDAGMPIGLISDLAIGADPGGSHAWSRQQDIVGGVSVGAPPDQLNAFGQNWGLTAFSPHGLRDNGYRAFIEMLRAAMAHAGGVRLDHVLGLLRLWLIPEGAAPTDGAYVRFPFDDLLRLIALESWRHRAIVIGENLGTVPDGFNARLAQRGVLGINVLWFEREGEAFLPPGRWSPDAVATTATHDLPTVAGWWQGHDLAWRARLGLLETSTAEADAARARERAALWQAFVQAGVADSAAPAETEPVVDAALAFVAKTPAALKVVPVEDLLGLVEQPNLPGTVSGHPNWQRRLPADSDSLFDRADVAQRAASLDAAAPGSAAPGTTSG
jgi:4-alpha-glucanotransferase